MVKSKELSGAFRKKIVDVYKIVHFTVHKIIYKYMKFKATANMARSDRSSNLTL